VGRPAYAALIAGQLCLYPAPTQAWNVELTYYAGIPALTATNTSNWLLTSFPDLYLWGALAEAWNYYEDDEQLQKAAALLKDAIDGYNEGSRASEMGFNLSPSPSVRAW
jgi:hypothetical protein